MEDGVMETELSEMGRQVAPGRLQRREEDITIEEHALVEQREPERVIEVETNQFPGAFENTTFIPCRIESDWNLWVASISDILWPIVLADSQYFPWLSPLTIAREKGYLVDPWITSVVIWLMVAYVTQFFFGVMLLIRLVIGTSTRMPIMNFLRLYWRVCCFLVVLMSFNALSAPFIVGDLGNGSKISWLQALCQILHVVVYISIRVMNGYRMLIGIIFQKAHNAGQHKFCKLARGRQDFSV